MNSRFEPARPPPRIFQSRRHLFPIFQMKDVGFWFILNPSSDCFIDPRPEFCELSKMGIPYPRMPQFARALLVQQNTCDLVDFIDGMNLDVAWAEENIDFEQLQVEGMQYAERQNALLARDKLGQLKTTRDFAAEWRGIAESKERRIEPMKKGRYLTCCRTVRNPGDPRLKDRDWV